MRHDQPLKAWIIQRNRRKRQNEVGPVEFAMLGDLESNVSPSLIPHPDLGIEGGTNYESLTWASSDESVIGFNSDTAPVRFDLKKAGTATITVTFTNADGSEYVTSKVYTIV